MDDGNRMKWWAKEWCRLQLLEAQVGPPSGWSVHWGSTDLGGRGKTVVHTEKCGWNRNRLLLAERKLASRDFLPSSVLAVEQLGESQERLTRTHSFQPQGLADSWATHSCWIFMVNFAFSTKPPETLWDFSKPQERFPLNSFPSDFFSSSQN